VSGAGISPAATAFVAGATGYTGREVVRALAARDVRTVAHVRPDSPRLAEWRERFAALGAEVDATPWERDALTATMRRLTPTHVFALLGTTRARARRAAAAGRPESYESVDYGLTMMLYESVVAAGLVPRFAYLSAAGVGAGSRNAYIAARWRVEEALRAGRLPYVIARPSFITGADRDEVRPLERVAAAAGDAVLTLAGALGGRRLRERWRSTTGAALAGALVRLALDPRAGRVVAESEELRG
jgi:uncharacterized protein YbjT (DUF2867 family)